VAPLAPAFEAAVRGVRMHGASKVVISAVAAQSASEEDPAAWAATLPRMVVSADGFARQLWLREAAGRVLVTAFLAGPRDAAVAEALSCDEAADRLAEQISALAGRRVAWVDAVKVDWGRDPFAQGAYSSPSVGMCGAWRDLFDTGLPHLRYAGEAAHERGSTVDSALEAGEAAARAILANSGRQ